MPNQICKIDPRDKIACFTLDFEMDYDGFGQEFNIYNEQKLQIKQLAKTFSNLKIPVSTFIRTDILDEYPGALKLIRILASDFHSHSHSHVPGKISKKDLVESVKAFKKYFGHTPLGYRAPWGMLFEKDINLLHNQGFKFSSSVFPSWRPGVYQNLRSPIQPFCYDNGLLEMPMAVVPYLRYVISISYLKLAGFGAFQMMHKTFGLPQILIIDSHLHDFVHNQASFRQQPMHLRAIGRRNRDRGEEYLRRLVQVLRDEGYSFMSMSELYYKLQKTK